MVVMFLHQMVESDASKQEVPQLVDWLVSRWAHGRHRGCSTRFEFPLPQPSTETISAPAKRRCSPVGNPHRAPSPARRTPPHPHLVPPPPPPQALPKVGENDYYSRFTYRPANREFQPDRVPV